MTEREEHRRRAPLRLVESYWQGLRGVDAVPLRAEVDPRGMENALEYAFLVERIAPSMAKFRVAGSHLSDLMGMQVSGMPVSTFIAPEDRDRFGQAVTRLFADPAILRMELQSDDGIGKPAMRGSLLLLPLRSDFGDVTRGLGALITDGRIGRTPRRFRLLSVQAEPVLAPDAMVPHAAGPDAGTRDTRTPKSMVQPSTASSAKAPSLPAPLPNVARRPAPATGMADAAAPFRPAARKHLRLVVDND